MSTRINLRIQTGLDLELFEMGTTLRLIRLITTMRLHTKNGWSEEFEAIIDTGSVVTVLPHFAWKNANIRNLSAKEIGLRGISSQKDAIINAKIAEIICIFHDKQRTSLPIKIKSYLFPDDSIPLIIGFEDALTKAKLVSDYKKNIAYLQF